MIKKLLLITTLIIFSQASQIDDLTLIYKEKGIKGVEKLLQENLLNESFWASFLKDKNLKYGYFENKKTMLLASKKSKKLHLIKNDLNSSQVVKSFDTITGKNGDKFKKGDKKTPIGIYSINKSFKPINNFYGPVALETNYPNLYDRLKEKTGSGIWIHGYPMTDELRDENFTKGCLAIQNTPLKELNSSLKNLKDVDLLIYEKDIPKMSKAHIALILVEMQRWREAWRHNDITRYLEFYSPEFKRFDGKNYKQFAKYKKRVFAKNEKKTIKFTNINILPYPNDKNKNIFRVTFAETYKSPTIKFKGNKELYVEVNDSMKILVEK